jgi:methylated-DNA-[protein]-cysteine S-methyltransferase
MELIYIGEVPSTPIGPVWVACSETGLVAVEIGATQEEFVAHLRKGRPMCLLEKNETRTAEATRQIREYLDGKLTEFTLPIDWSVMGGFQEQALRLTLGIPYGQVTTYGELARQLNQPRAARAVGRAEATNPMPLVIPCHRVVGADGGLHGYGAPGGIQTKAWLQRLEGRQPSNRV